MLVQHCQTQYTDRVNKCLLLRYLQLTSTRIAEFGLFKARTDMDELYGESSPSEIAPFIRPSSLLYDKPLPSEVQAHRPCFKI